MNNYELRVEYVEYVVKKGDSLYSISKMYDTSVNELIDINKYINSKNKVFKK